MKCTMQTKNKFCLGNNDLSKLSMVCGPQSRSSFCLIYNAHMLCSVHQEEGGKKKKKKNLVEEGGLEANWQTVYYAAYNLPNGFIFLRGPDLSLPFGKLQHCKVWKQLLLASAWTVLSSYKFGVWSFILRLINIYFSRPNIAMPFLQNGNLNVV